MGDVLNLRRRERHVTAWSAYVELGDLLLNGTIRDFSGVGLFFEPEASYVDGGLVSGGEALSALSPEDVVRVVVIDGRGRAGCVIPVEVRWMGFSERHGAFGLGAQSLADGLRTRQAA